MKRTLFFAAGFALTASIAASTVVFAEDATMSGVDVDVMLEDVANANALEFWPEIEGDLETAIAGVAADKITDDGYEISVELKEISLSGSTVLTGEGEFNHMEGWVYFREPGNAVPVHQEELVVDAETLTVGYDENGLKTPDLPEFYAGLLLGFANGAVAELETLDPVGSDVTAENRQGS